MGKPLVSIIMAEYNTDIQQFKESLNSILNQTYKNFEIIIVDDCGQTDVKTLLKSYDDQRIRYYRNKENIGLAESLNFAISKANSDYIMRMDTDDIMLPNRIEKQIRFALNNLNYSIIGSRCLLFDGEKEFSESSFSGEVIKKDFLFGTPFTHPTLLIKKEDLIKCGGYPNYRRAQDYAMEMNMYSHGFTGYIMDDILLKYRQDKKGYKKKKYKYRILEYKIRKKYFKQLGLPWYRVIFEIKPLFVGLIPKFILKKIHEKDKNGELNEN